MFSKILSKIYEQIIMQLVGYYDEVLSFAEDIKWEIDEEEDCLKGNYKGKEVISVAANKMLYEIVNIKKRCEEYEERIWKIEKGE